MRSISALALGIVTTCLVCCSGACMAAFPVPDGFAPITILRGWHADEAVWYANSLSSDPKFAEVPQSSIPGTRTLTFVPGFSALADSSVVGDMYVVVNYVQGPVFSSTPLEPDEYTPLWRVSTVTWLDPNIARPITNDRPAGPDNPTGLPSDTEAIIGRTSVVVNASIVAVGPLKCAWLPAPEGTYRIAQGIECDQWSKTLLVPVYNVFCQNAQTRRGIWLRQMMILDAADPITAYQCRANLSTKLAALPQEFLQRLYVMNEPKPMSQFPILRECPTVFGARNTNFGYTPLMLITAMDRRLPLSSVINNPPSLDWLLQAGLLSIVEETRIVNAPLIPEL